MNLCLNCGSDVPTDPSDPAPPQASHCPNCPPTRCEDCGEMCEWHPGGRLCSCWTSLADLPLADAKALFACDCEGDEDELSLDPDVTSR